MASYTTNLNLKKPAGSENVAIGDINNNMDAIDQACGSLINGKANKAYLVSSTSGTTHEITFPNSAKCIVVGVGGSTARQFAAIVDVSSTGGVTMTEIISASGVTLSTSANKLIITYAASASAYVGVVSFSNADISNMTIT